MKIHIVTVDEYARRMLILANILTALDHEVTFNPALVTPMSGHVGPFAPNWLGQDAIIFALPPHYRNQFTVFYDDAFGKLAAAEQPRLIHIEEGMW